MRTAQRANKVLSKKSRASGFSSWASDLIDHENQVTEVV